MATARTEIDDYLANYDEMVRTENRVVLAICVAIVNTTSEGDAGTLSEHQHRSGFV